MSDETTNTDRAAWALTALEAFVAAVGGGLDNDEDAHCAAGDLIANIRHWADERGLDFNAMLGSAMGHYFAETCTDDPEHMGCETCDERAARYAGSIDESLAVPVPVVVESDGESGTETDPEERDRVSGKVRS